jgi:uncharacterized protein involved in exopolysaccharide biosynthesis
MENFNSLSALKIFLKWKWYLLGIAVVTIILSYIFTGPTFITPKYKSETVVYPANLISRSTESNTEQMMQWLSSREIKDSIIKIYNLKIHYDIDTTEAGYYDEVIDIFNKWSGIYNTKYQAIKIEAFDKDSLLAYRIVESFLDFYDKKINKEYKKKYKENVRINKKFLLEKKAELDSVLTIHSNLSSKYQLLDYLVQTKEATKGYLGTLENPNERLYNKKAVNRLKKNLQEKGGEFILYHKRLFDLINQYNGYQAQYEAALKNFQQTLSYYYTVESPIISSQDSYPNRAKITLLVLLAVLLFSIVVIIFIEYFNIVKE